jgi:adenylate kinase family enzyme
MVNLLRNLKESVYMKRVMIIGSGGAGKSTLAKQLGSLMNLPVIHLDAHFWNPNWVETERPAWIEMQKQLMHGEQWLIAGNYSATLDVRMSKADTIIYLDYSRFSCLLGVIKRRIQYAGKSRPDMCAGCPERLDFEFLKWVWNYRKNKRPKVVAMLEDLKREKNVIIFSDRSELNDWLGSIPSKVSSTF